MNYLLDTHVVLWAAANSKELSENAKTIILDANAPKYVSIISAWEVAIKLGTHKLYIDGGLPEFYRMIDNNGFYTIGIEREYISLLEQLPQIHRDPFDRMLIATALAEDFTLVTIDENIQKYDVPQLW
ncbi:MAG: type II toxin-antitoxin system VapC family toxin [Oscillospiraceae bacterium]|jgi:PIN domain nuclease of toxin-antitoxin system|nr:type II toxin-antitoxin system VapC family toxin [Oscillospiraceae bacterium]